jgi:hypothetical protein
MFRHNSFSPTLDPRRLIEDTHAEAFSFGLGKLSIRERDFVSSVFNDSQRPTFTGLTEAQLNWLSAISQKLNATKGKHRWEIISERSKHRLQRYRSAYTTAIFGR